MNSYAQKMNNYAQKMKEDALKAIIEALKNGYSGYYSELHNEVFNTNYYIIGTYRAEKALEEYGVFDALRTVREYEQDNFGEIITDLSNPEKFVNMLYYIIGEEVLFEMMEKVEAWEDDNYADEETNAAILAELKE